jgi:hypothetical protein
MYTVWDWVDQACVYGSFGAGVGASETGRERASGGGMGERADRHEKHGSMDDEDESERIIDCGRKWWSDPARGGRCDC